MIDSVCNPIRSNRFERTEKVVVFLHGYGSCGKDLMGYFGSFRNALENTLMFFPTAPLAPDHKEFYSGAGRMWFSIPEDFSETAIRNGLNWIGPIILEYISRIMKEHGVSASNVSFIGFSQGAIVSLEMLFLLGIDKIISYSGIFVVPDDVSNISRRTKVLLVHSDDDLVVPYTKALEAKKNMGKLGIESEVYTCKGVGHSISIECVEVGIGFLNGTYKPQTI